MLEGKVLKDFNDGQNNLKNYPKGSIYRGEEKRYNELKAKGSVGVGKKVEETKENKGTKKADE